MLEANQSVGLRVWSAGTADEFGNKDGIHATAVARAVYGWAPAGTSEPFEAARAPVTWDLDLLVPPEFTCQPKDRVVVPGYTKEFEVDGIVRHYNHGPFGFTPGGVVRLTVVTG